MLRWCVYEAGKTHARIWDQVGTILGSAGLDEGRIFHASSVPGRTTSAPWAWSLLGRRTAPTGAKASSCARAGACSIPTRAAYREALGFGESTWVRVWAWMLPVEFCWLADPWDSISEDDRMDTIRHIDYIVRRRHD